jgi:type I restriction enzyme S subunit
MREPQLVPLSSLLIGIDAGHSPDVEDTPAASGEWGVLKVSAVGADGFHPQENKVVREERLHNPALRVRAGDLLITRANTSQLVGLTCIAGETSSELMLSDKTLRLRVNKRVAPTKYIQAALGSPIVRRQIENLATGTSGSMKNISQGSIQNLMIPFSGTEDAGQIAAILDSADKQIQVSLRLLAKQEATLKGLEFAAVRDSISSPPITIGDIIRNAPGGLIQTGPFGSQLHAYEYTESGVPVVMPQDMIGQSIAEEKIVRIRESKAQALSRHRMIPGDVVFGRRGDLSRCAVVAPEQEGWLCGTGCLLARLPSGPVRPEWLALAYRHDIGQRQVQARAVGSTMVNLNTKIISGITIPVPDIKEQERKIFALAVHRRAITCLSLEIDKQNIIKQGVMDDLLTGRVRVAALYLGVKFAIVGDVIRRGEHLVEVVAEFFKDAE